jgi:hypothetical protein
VIDEFGLERVEETLHRSIVIAIRHMRTPWTLSTIEAAIFIGLVLILAGAGTWASVIS